MKIGIITIHRLINFGTALQAYALQYYLQKTTSHQVELIDYVFPNSYHKKRKSFINSVRGIARFLLDCLFEKKFAYNKKFKGFQNNYFTLSNKQYTNATSLSKTPPVYDIYITGSDQVWNTKTVHNDPNFYLCFVPKNKPKIAFSACFANDLLEDEYKESVRERLSSYKYIGVRERSAIDIIKDLHIPQDIVVKNTCDPTLLLSKEDYHNLSANSRLDIKGKYILVYALMYAFNPYPALNEVIKQISERTNLPIIVIGDRRFRYKGKYKFIKGIGPIDFLWLFEHASYIITSSFHGLMFSLIYRKPFTVISTHEGDCRIKDTLYTLGLTDNLVYSNEKKVSIKAINPYTDDANNRLNNFIKSSKDFLDNAIIKSL